jgi:alkylation response protein AidB-like acyl-CoA dehydrogenase
MDLKLSPEYETFRDEVRAFLAARGGEAPRGVRDQRDPNRLTWQRTLIEHGYAARTIPAEYGGYGAEPDILKSRIISEEFAASGVPGGIASQGISMLVPTLLELGTEAQKTQWIGRTLRGETIWCQGYSEPGSGSDLASLKTAAVVDGEDFVINGQKIWTSTAMQADMMFALIRTEADAPKHQGISFLLLSMDTPGIEVRPLVDMTGAANFNEVFFTDVRVPVTQIVSERGRGWNVANAVLTHERGMLGDPNAGMSRLAAIIKLMETETLDGHRVMDNPVYRDRLIRLQAEVHAMKMHGMRLMTMSLQGESKGIAGLIVKLQGCELNHQLAGFAIDVMGELGILYEDGDYLRSGGSWQSRYMYDLGLIIGGGTAQIQKNIISERGLGMPREPKAAKV